MISSSASNAQDQHYRAFSCNGRRRIHSSIHPMKLLDPSLPFSESHYDKITTKGSKSLYLDDEQWEVIEIRGAAESGLTGLGPT
ncbi:hypothetical protein CDL12_00779 [Handroanthus impetiginosus]|uniref:Uncharacterized protein n=1 Tax=Handroanthus impetiginosus TaxID=429701 RepID=A0A2G9I9N4_9LAMI|nr:hypothetical protein CDL12_00779 [Handroanthus impetiginosus]